MKIVHSFLLLSFIVITGCSDGSGVIRPPPTNVGVFNAASNLEFTVFLREERVLAQMNYGEGEVASFDSGQYDFHVEHSPVGATAPVRAFSFSETLSPDLNYIFVVIAPGGQPEAFAVTTENLAGDAANGRVTIVHAFEGMGDLDVYMELPGTILSNAQPQGSMSFGPNALTFDIAPDTYHLYLTLAGDPDTVVFESVDDTVVAGADDVLVVSDPGAMGALTILVSRISANTGRIGQFGSESRLRAVHGIDDRLARDIHLDDTTTPALFPAQPFGVLSDYLSVEVDAHSVITTPQDNPGTEEGATSYFAVSGALQTVLIAGDSVDGVSTTVMVEDKRSIAGQATLRILNGAGLFDAVGVFVEPPGTDTTTATPLGIMSVPSFTPRVPLVPGDFEITIQDAITGTILAGPELVSMIDGGVYGVLLLNAEDGSTVDIQLFDDLIP